MSDDVILDLSPCARCGKPHEGLTFQKFRRSIYAGPFEVLTHWAMCPELDQPILMGHRELSQFAGSEKGDSCC